MRSHALLPFVAAMASFCLGSDPLASAAVATSVVVAGVVCSALMTMRRPAVRWAVLAAVTPTVVSLVESLQTSAFTRALYAPSWAQPLLLAASATTALLLSLALLTAWSLHPDDDNAFDPSPDATLRPSPRSHVALVCAPAVVLGILLEVVGVGWTVLPLVGASIVVCALVSTAAEGPLRVPALLSPLVLLAVAGLFATMSLLWYAVAAGPWIGATAASVCVLVLVATAGFMPLLALRMRGGRAVHVVGAGASPAVALSSTLCDGPEVAGEQELL